MKRVRRWFKSRHGLFTEIQMMDKLIRDLTAQLYVVQHQWDDSQESLITVCKELQDKVESQHLILAALGAVQVNAND